MKHLVIVFAILLSACSSGTNTPPSHIGFACPEVEMIGNMVYPISGATGVVDTDHLIIVSAGLQSAVLTLSATSGQTLTSASIIPVPNPLPTPNDPSVLGTYQAYRIPALAPATTYTITSTTQTSTSCGTNAFYGSFTTL